MSATPNNDVQLQLFIYSLTDEKAGWVMSHTNNGIGRGPCQAIASLADWALATVHVTARFYARAGFVKLRRLPLRSAHRWRILRGAGVPTCWSSFFSLLSSSSVIVSTFWRCHHTTNKLSTPSPHRYQIKNNPRTQLTQTLLLPSQQTATHSNLEYAHAHSQHLSPVNRYALLYYWRFPGFPLHSLCQPLSRSRAV